MKTIYLEPDTINPESCLTVEQSGSLQFIHFKLIKNEAALYRLLARTYGEKKFEIEMRHNVYRIRAPSGCAALDLVSPPIPFWKCGD